MESEDLQALTVSEIEHENIARQKRYFNELYDVWHKVGIDDEQLKSRTISVWNHVHNLLTEIMKEENSYYEDIMKRIKSYQKKIHELTTALSLPKIEELDGTLIMQEKALRHELDKLSKLKHQRIKEFQDLRAAELKFCKILDKPPLKLSSSTGVPSDKDLNELQEHVNMLKNERNERHRKLCILKKELTTILEITEITPETSLEKEILTSSEDCLSLSNETFKILEQMVTKTKHKKADMESKKKILLEKLALLWQRLSIPESEKEKFLSTYNDCRLSTLKAIEQEVIRCEEIKKQNIKKFVDALKEELFSLWEKCFISELERKKFLENCGDDINEEVLEVFDNEVTRLKMYFSEIESIVTKITKRNELMELMLALENKANDPNRFKNRKGNLLKEERERKKIQKDLPALENEIFRDIEVFEKPFLYFGEDFRDFVTKQWDERNAQKESEKLMKQRMRSQQIENELTLGTTPCKRPLAMTPKSAPSKLFKSTFGIPVYRTPGIATRSKPTPNTTGKSIVQKTGIKSVVKNILKEKNKSEKSGSLNSTTYTDFADKLNRSSRHGLRSSAVLTSKKIVGTRMSHNSSSRKSAGKSTQKPIKKIMSSKITPVRGKLGLPIII